MLQRYPLLYSGMSVATVGLMTLLCLGVAEMLAESVEFDQDFFDYEADHIALKVRTFALPNYWVWYSPEAVYEAVEALRGGDVTAALLVTVFNCCVCSACVMVFGVTAMLFVMTKVLPRNSVWLSLWVLPAIAFVLDLLEDFVLMLVLLGYPRNRYQRATVVASWTSLGKYALWFTSLVITTAFALKWLLRGPLPKQSQL